MDRVVIQHTSASDPFKEVILYVQQIYEELAQNKPNFSDYSCIFCRSEYFELGHLISHIEDFHRNQVLDDSINFEKHIYNKILAKESMNAHQKMEYVQEQLYQCAKCFATFQRVEDVTQHLAQCAMEDVYHQHQQNDQQIVIPTVQIRDDIYGCARCGNRFRLVRELVLHLHLCIVDTFHDKDEFLLPSLWVQAPDGQHIVINETETNTTLNTTGLWLMSDDGIVSADIIAKGFWVMPPPNNHDLPMTTLNAPVIKDEPPSATPPQSVVVMPLYEEYTHQPLPVVESVAIPNNHHEQSDSRYIQTDASGWMDSTIKKPKSYVDDSKRKKGRAKVISSPIKEKKTVLTSNTYSTSITPAMPTKYIYINNEIDVMQLNESSASGTSNGTKRKRYDIPNTTSVSQQYENTSNMNVQNYVISSYDEASASPHILTKDDIIYETVDYGYKEHQQQKILQQQIDNHLAMQEYQKKIQHQLPPQLTPTRQYQKQQPQKQQPQKHQPQKQQPQKQPQEPQKVQYHLPVPPPVPQPAVNNVLENCDIDDLSHLDTPINDIPTVTPVPIKKRQSDYIESYCSFLKSRTLK